MHLITGYYLLFFPTLLLLWIVDALVYRITQSERRFYMTGIAYALATSVIAGACMFRASLPGAPMDWLKPEFLISAGLAIVTLLILFVGAFAVGFGKLVEAIRGPDRASP